MFLQSSHYPLPSSTLSSVGQSKPKTKDKDRVGKNRGAAIHSPRKYTMKFMLSRVMAFNRHFQPLQLRAGWMRIEDPKRAHSVHRESKRAEGMQWQWNTFYSYWKERASGWLFFGSRTLWCRRMPSEVDSIKKATNGMTNYRTPITSIAPTPTPTPTPLAGV